MARLPAARADLHIHTTASDGDHSPATVVALAREAGLAAIAVADHDSVDGIAEAQAAAAESALRVVSAEQSGLGVASAEQSALRVVSAEQSWLRVVPAVEISTDHRGAEVHILGYFVDPQDEELREFLAGQRASRTERAQAMVAKLCALGYHVEFERVRELAAGAIGRPHIAAALIEQGLVPSIDAAMRNLLGRGCAAYVPRRKFSPVEAVSVVRRAQGAAVFAHPGISGREWLLSDLMSAGLVGIEAYHPQHTAAQQQRYAALARAKGLIATGGSDFHGPHWEDNVGVGGVSVAATVVEELLQRLAAESR